MARQSGIYSTLREILAIRADFVQHWKIHVNIYKIPQPFKKHGNIFFSFNMQIIPTIQKYLQPFKIIVNIWKITGNIKFRPRFFRPTVGRKNLDLIFVC